MKTENTGHDLTALPALFMRGGTSSGLYWNAADLPREVSKRDAVLLAAMGTCDGTDPTPDPRQLNGLGKGTPVTSKTAILSPSPVSGVDIDYLFAQIALDRCFVDTSPSCGNILAGVAHAALEMGLVQAEEAETRLRIRNVNTGTLIESCILTPGRRWSYLGETRLDGVPGRGAPVRLNFLDVIGSKCGSMFPTGAMIESIEGLDVTLLDVAVPMVWFRASQLGLTGSESSQELNANTPLLARMESVRLIASRRMGLGEARGRVVPKMGLAAPPRGDGHMASRYFVPQACHPTHAVTGAVCGAAGAVTPGTLLHDEAAASGAPLTSQELRLEHPGGVISIHLTYEDGAFVSAGVLRTARKIMQGHVFVPSFLLS